MFVRKFFELFTKNPFLLWLVVIVNLGGTVFGVYYYWPQFEKVSIYLLPIVPDSPTATLLIALSLIFIFFKKESKILNNFAYFGLLKIGIWTLFTMVVYKHFFFSPDHMWYYSILFVLHAGMVVEAFVLQNRLSFELKDWLPVSLFYLIGDFCDYYLGTVPTPLPIDRPDLLVWLMIESFVFTVGLSFYFVKKRGLLSQ